MLYSTNEAFCKLDSVLGRVCLVAVIRWAQCIDSITQVDPVHVRNCVNAALEGLRTAFNEVELTSHVSSIVDNFEDLAFKEVVTSSFAAEEQIGKRPFRAWQAEKS